MADAGGEEAARAKYGDNAEALKASKWQSFKVAARVTPRASRVAAFIALWGLALDELDRDELTVDEYAEWANEVRATAFRRAAGYREPRRRADARRASSRSDGSEAGTQAGNGGRCGSCAGRDRSAWRAGAASRAE